MIKTINELGRVDPSYLVQPGAQHLDHLCICIFRILISLGAGEEYGFNGVAQAANRTRGSGGLTLFEAFPDGGVGWGSG